MLKFTLLANKKSLIFALAFRFFVEMFRAPLIIGAVLNLIIILLVVALVTD